MLIISIVMSILPLFGIVWTIATGSIKTVDGLFMTLIMLTLSGTFFLNAYWELRDRGMLAFLHRKPKTPVGKEKGTSPSSTGTGA